MSYTKGPWTVMATGAFPVVYGPAGERICRVIDNPDDVHFIAAAPDLYEALDRLEKVSGLPTLSNDQARAAAREALRKARGEE